MGVRMDKARILTKIRAERAKLDAAMAGLTEEQMLRPGVQDEWTIKDMSAHIAFWDARLAGRLEAVLQDAPQPLFDFLSTDTANHHVYQQNRVRPLADIQAEATTHYSRILHALEQLSDADLTDPLRFAWTKRKPLRWYVFIDGYGHYPEHPQAIQAWRAREALAAAE